MNNNYDNYFWDFDGVLIESDDIRTAGFEHVFRAYNTSVISKIINFHKKNGGLSRYFKINHFYEVIIKKKLTKDLLELHLTDYTNFVYERLINPKLLISENLTFIKKNQSKNHFIVSASDEKELKSICNNLKIDYLFSEIKGSPQIKENNILSIISKNKLNKAKCVLIGDSINDLNAATIANIDFIGFNNPELESMSSRKSVN
tara:strand:+ start:7553 stop:8161 length:609 start_codon:yes stop_codon:yes gene_type:complete